MASPSPAQMLTYSASVPIPDRNPLLCSLMYPGYPQQRTVRLGKALRLLGGDKAATNHSERNAEGERRYTVPSSGPESDTGKQTISLTTNCWQLGRLEDGAAPESKAQRLMPSRLL